MYTVATKSLLAKLMATENIKVEHHARFQTASFDLKNRVLRCPVWKDMGADVYDLLMGHEISHALRTPFEGWHDSVIYAGGNKKATPKEQKAFKHFLNVVEDARIEKLLKRQYPGIRRPMANGYKQLMAKDFFGLSAISDYNNLYLIDKLNLSAKVGVLLNIRFTAKEKPFNEEMQALETWEDVVALAKKLYDYSKTEQQEGERSKEELKRQLEEEQDKERQEEEEEEERMRQEEGDDYDGDEEYGDEGDDDEGDDEGDGEEDSDDDEGDDEGDGEEDSDDEEGDEGKKSDAKGEDAKDDKEKKADDKTTEKGKDKGKGSRKEKDDNKSGGNTTNIDGAKKNSDDNEPFVPSAKTDESFRDKEQKLVETENINSVYVKIPTPNLNDVVTPAAIVNKGLTNFYAKHRATGVRLLNEFKKKNEDYVMLMAKEFEMKKAARSYKKAKVSESGDIDINKLATYRLEDDIFKKMLIVNKGKSHGLVLILDKSGSMSAHIEAATEQILIMALFCRKVNIPFAAYSFTNTSGRAHEHDFPNRYNTGMPLAPFSKNPNEIQMGDLDFRELLNSKMQAADFNQAMMNLLFVARTLSHHGQEGHPSHEDMGSTPLNEALVVLRDVLRNFKMMHRLDIVNAVIVHDGDSDNNCKAYGEIVYKYSSTDYKRFDTQRERVTIRDEKEKLDFALPMNTYGGLTIGLLKWIQMTAHCGVFGFYITGDNMKSIRHPLHKMYRNKLGVGLGTEDRRSGVTDQTIVADKLCKQVIEEKFLESYSEGYTRFFFLPGGKELKADSGELVTTGKSWTPSRLLSAFMKVNRKKSVSRVLVSRFIELIAVAHQE